ncbi:MAG: hydrogenase maturation nickel metallochaperone HypA [Nitrospinae bacterium]|nr:hydrogenase maturation nickel metallochaperone HypA [Nitrospinota bacterium]
MHEMSIALSIIDIAHSQAQKINAKKINEVEVEIGEMAGVVKEALLFCFDSASKGTSAEGAQLKVIDIPGEGKCSQCGNEFPTSQEFSPCPKCGEFLVALIKGKELKVKTINID